MKPEKPPRHITEVNVSAAPHTPVPDAPTVPPPAMRMPPPRAYAAPRPRLESFRDIEHRPEPANPPPHEFEMQAPERETQLPVGHVTVGKGKFTLSMPSAVALALIACLGGALTAWINKSDPAKIAETVHNEMAKAAEDRQRYEAAATARQDGLETALGDLSSSVNSLRDRFNDKFPPAALPIDPLAARMNKRLTK